MNQTMRPIVTFVYHSDLLAVGPAVIQGLTIAALLDWDLNLAKRTERGWFRKLIGHARRQFLGSMYVPVPPARARV